MRAVTLGSLGAVAPIAAPTPGVYGFGDVAADPTMTTKHVVIFGVGVLVGALGMHFSMRKKRRR